MINFKLFPGKSGGMYLGQSDWISNIYNNLFSEKKNGFVVEIGVGCVLDWESMGTPRLLEESDSLLQGKSATIELLEHGWSGIYVEPIREFLYNELEPLLNKILPDGASRVKMLPYAASDVNGFVKIVKDETLDNQQYSAPTPESEVIPYNYHNRIVETRVIADLLTENDCPQDIDVLLIDVEGYELNVLRGFDFSKHQPKLIFIEIDKVPLHEIMQHIPSDYNVLMQDGLNAAIVKE